jgi:hypothetical protein
VIAYAWFAGGAAPAAAAAAAGGDAAGAAAVDADGFPLEFAEIPTLPLVFVFDVDGLSTCWQCEQLVCMCGTKSMKSDVLSRDRLHLL